MRGIMCIGSNEMTNSRATANRMFHFDDVEDPEVIDEKLRDTYMSLPDLK